VIHSSAPSGRERALQLHIADVAAELAARDRLDAMFVAPRWQSPGGPSPSSRRDLAVRLPTTSPSRIDDPSRS